MLNFEFYNLKFKIRIYMLYTMMAKRSLYWKYT